MTDDYDRGQRDGLRLALAILAAEEARWFLLLGKSRSRCTNAVRKVRRKTLQVAQPRVQRALNKLKPKGGQQAANPELDAALERLGL